MSAADTRYAPSSDADVTQLVLEHPLAWVVSMTSDECRGTPLPLRPEPAGDNQPIQSLLGHFARSNPQVELLKSSPRALVLFMGVNGYVSPSRIRDRTQAPTWNYAAVQYVVDIEFIGEHVSRDAVVADLVKAMELGRPKAWSAAEMGARYRRLADGIVAFRATIVERRAKFKLGQDERDDVYAGIIAAIADPDLVDWMCRANPARHVG